MSPSAISPELGAQRLPEQIANTTANSNGHFNGEDISHANGYTNGYTNGHANGQINNLKTTSPNETLDLLCIGFGPASLAIAIALHDQQLKSPATLNPTHPSVLFLEKQPHFAWHSGMQLPGAKMQISFLKDLATPRDPTSSFTFLNYLFKKRRLNHFINLSTFLPTREEYEDYLRWCAGHFEEEGRVIYGVEVKSVRVGERSEEGKVLNWEVTAVDENGGVAVITRARHVVVAVGGKPVIPEVLRGLKHVAHSSQYANIISKIREQQQQNERRLRFAVLGSGQSAAEIFNDLWESFPKADVSMVIKGASLRPSDDSPFVNEIFNPDRVTQIYNQEPSVRAHSLALDRGTNYGVVRLELLEHLYSKLYTQRLHNPNEKQWRCKILPNRTIVDAQQGSNGSVALKLRKLDDDGKLDADEVDEEMEMDLEVDYIFTATGYVRNAHEEILSGVIELLPPKEREEGRFPVARDYRVLFEVGKVDESAGVWLQGCNESTHGLSDTLLSILAVRGGEMVESMFGV